MEKKICARIESLGRKKICASGSIFLGGEEFVLGWELGWDLSWGWGNCAILFGENFGFQIEFMFFMYDGMFVFTNNDFHVLLVKI